MDMPAPSIPQTEPVVWLLPDSPAGPKMFLVTAFLITEGYGPHEDMYVVKNALNKQEAFEHVVSSIRASKWVDFITILPKLGFDELIEIHYKDNMPTHQFGVDIEELEFDENGVADL